MMQAEHEKKWNALIMALSSLPFTSKVSKVSKLSPSFMFRVTILAIWDRGSLNKDLTRVIHLLTRTYFLMFATRVIHIYNVDAMDFEHGFFMAIWHFVGNIDDWSKIRLVFGKGFLPSVTALLPAYTSIHMLNKDWDYEFWECIIFISLKKKRKKKLHVLYW